ncbi:serine protease [Streptacidiphilus anmyonensis]|uniref:serine protease n=1 Tax=Streptacidiphilus anmyonensis TaxID=405782 RepID=UPI00128BF58F|nr:serine protease [Streptacidiphilus anmyonensis]
MRVSDSRGTLRGLAFGVDHDGTLVTAHEVVDGLAGVRLAYPDGRSARVDAGRIVPLPEHGLALLRSDFPPGAPWPLADGTGTRLVCVPGQGAALQGAVTRLVTARYEASERFWLLPDVWQLSLEQAPSGLPVHAAGGPVVDAETGAAVGVATAALRSRRRGAVLAVRLGAVAGEPLLADLLARNAETVPAHGRALNLAGVLELAAAGIDAAATEAGARRVPRADGLLETVQGQGWDPVRTVLAVVGEAGSGRTTELAAVALHRTRAAYRLPTLWLRGADLAAGDASVLDAADRVLGRVQALLRHPAPAPLAGQAARVAAAAHRPLLIVLDAPEEAPPQLLARWRGWCAQTVRRLRATESRLVLGCLPEFWERTCSYLGPDDVQGECRLGPLDPGTAGELALLRQAPGVTPGVVTRGVVKPLVGTEPGVAGLVAAGDALALRLLGEVRAAQPALALPRSRAVTRTDLLSARLDLACLQIAERLAAQAVRPVPAPEPALRPGAADVASSGLSILWRRSAQRADAQAAQAAHAASPTPAAEMPGADLRRPCGHAHALPRAVRRLAARVAGRCHEAARRTLGAPDGGLTAREFDELFPWAEGWAQAALGEGVFVAAGNGYRFASGALADWLQGFHLDLPVALTMILADTARPAEEPPPGRPVGAHRRGGPLGWPPPVPVPGQPTGGGVPRWRLAVVRQALLGLDADDPAALESLLSRLVLRLDGPEAAPPGSEAHWWAERLLTDTLQRLPDAAPYAPLLRALAGRIVSSTSPQHAAGGAWSAPIGVWGGGHGERGGLGSDLSGCGAVQGVPGVGAAEAHAVGGAWSVPIGARGGEHGERGGLGSDLSGCGAVQGVPGPRVGEAEAAGAAWSSPSWLPDGDDGEGSGVGTPAALALGAHGSAWSAAAAGRHRDGQAADDRAACGPGFPAAGAGGAPSDCSVPDGLRDGGEPVTGARAAGAKPSRGVPFLPWDFWRRLPLTVEARLDVLRVLVRAGREEPGRLLGEVVVQDPAAALPPLCRWLADERVSGVAAETLFAYRHVALDELAEALVDAAHPRADALLRALAQAEPSALGRAVDRWAHDPRPERHVAAATVLPLLARQPAVGAPAERTLVRLAAEALLARGEEESLHGAAYVALVSDPLARPKRLRAAVARYLAGDPLLGAAALAPALDGDPTLVLAGYAGRLREPGEEAAAVLRVLGATPAPRARAAAARLVREHLQRRPEAAAQVGGGLRARLAHGPAERETLLAFARAAAAEQPEPVRWRLAEALADLDCVLARELRGLLRPAVTSPMRIQDQAHGKV